MITNNTEKIEKQLLSLIIETTNNDFTFSEKYKNPTQKLFEHIFYSEEVKSPVLFNDFRNNSFYFLNQVKNEIINLQNQIDRESLKVINESLSYENSLTINDFINDINLELLNFKKQNDFDKIDSLNPLVKQTLIFSGKPLKILNFNVNDYLLKKELEEKFGINNDNLKQVILNKTNKEIYFITENKINNQRTMIFYSIENNVLDYFNKYDESKFYENYGISLNLFLQEFWKDNKNYINIIKKYLTNNIVEIYRNLNLFDIKFTDNLYGDLSYQKRMNLVQSQNVVKR